MSASQTPSPGRTPNGTGGPLQRRRRPVDPLVRPKKPGQARPQATNRGPRPNSNGSAAAKPAPSQLKEQQPGPDATDDLGPYDDIPIVTTKRALLHGFRHHVMRFLPNSSASVASVNPADESQFTRPVRLHRRDPRANPATQYREVSPNVSFAETKTSTVDEKEKERLEALKAQKQAEREANQAQIAPVIKNNQPPKQQKTKFQKKTEQVYQASESSGRKQDLQLRYEESLPWHLEDDDNKSTWMGTYEAALSSCHIMFLPETSAGAERFRMVPLEKWYKFTARNQFKALSIEEAEALMGLRPKDPRWFKETQRQTQQGEKDERERRAATGLYTRKGERGERMTSMNDGGDEEKPEMALDADDIDYNYEEAFADDEENLLFGGDDEEVKEAEDKIKREQREANVFELKEEKDFDEEEQNERNQAEQSKKLSKATQKSLIRREKNFDYEDDSDKNPYGTSSESEDSDEEAAKAEEVLKIEKPDADKSGTDGGDKAGRPKSTDPARKGIKRPGSPNLSEASGNESSHKKSKKRPSSPSNSSATGEGRTAQPKISLDVPRENTNVRKISFHSSAAGSGSEGELSDTSKKMRRPKMQSSQNSRSGSPNGSRAGSPSGATSPLGAGQAGSDGSGAATAKKNPAPPPPLPDPDALKASIPREGIALHDLVKHWKPATKNPDFYKFVKLHLRWDRTAKLLFSKSPDDAEATPTPTSA